MYTVANDGISWLRKIDRNVYSVSVHFLHYTSTRKIMKLLLQYVYIHAADYWIGMYVYLLIVNYVVQEYCVVVADKYEMLAESCWICI